MIEKLSIRNFKSIKELDIDCKKINLFIGEPNTGKSNLLEALGLLSWCGHGGGPLKRFLRFQETQNLFYDDLLEQSIEINIKTHKTIRTEVKFDQEKEKFAFRSKISNQRGQEKKIHYAWLSYNGDDAWPGSHENKLQFIKFYRFEKQEKFPEKKASFLLPPHGTNLFSVVMTKKKLRETVNSFFKSFGFTLLLKPQERTLEIMKQIEDVAISYPYILTSDTLQRIIFHVIAMESNQNSTLVFEEPESHAFPYYTKYLGEKIAFDETNQYFIATHNPYLLNAIIEKAPKDAVNVFVCYFEDYQTKVKCLSKKQLSELLDFDPFFNLKAFIGEEDQ